MSWTPTWPGKTQIDKLHPRLNWIARLFQMTMKDYGSAATVNHGTDGQHSVHSAHGDGRAVDINHKDLRFPWASITDLRAWTAASYQLAGQLVRIANQLARLTNTSVVYYLVVEGSHWHLELTVRDGDVPNIKGWERGKFLYSTQEVKDIIGGTNG
jgi:hypothetical protein